MADPAVLTATTLEGQALEILRELQQAEDAYIAAGQALTPPVQRARRLSVSPNITTGLITYNLTLPITTTDQPDGYSLTVTPYLP